MFDLFLECCIYLIYILFIHCYLFISPHNMYGIGMSPQYVCTLIYSWTMNKQLRVDNPLQCVSTVWRFIIQPQVTLWCQHNHCAGNKPQTTTSESWVSLCNYTPQSTTSESWVSLCSYKHQSTTSESWVSLYSYTLGCSFHHERVTGFSIQLYTRL